MLQFGDLRYEIQPVENSSSFQHLIFRKALAGGSPPLCRVPREHQDLGTGGEIANGSRKILVIEVRAPHPLFRNPVSTLSEEISLLWLHLLRDLTDVLVFGNTLVIKKIKMICFDLPTLPGLVRTFVVAVPAVKRAEIKCYFCTYQCGLFIIYASVLRLHWVKEIERRSEMLPSDNNTKHLGERITYQLYKKYSFLNCYNFTEFTENPPERGEFIIIIKWRLFIGGEG